VQDAHSSKLHNEILVAPRSGRTLYHPVHESSNHIMCTGACTKLRPPLLVHSRQTQLKAGAGVHGRLSIIRRPDGKLQAAFNGMPLYTLSGDHRRGDLNGRGVPARMRPVPRRVSGAARAHGAWRAGGLA
jgi:predicted lipoprotein with Yx(FWY)xxD motif